MRETPRKYFTDFPELEWCGQYVLGGEEGHTPIPCYSMIEWGRFIEDRERVIVARTGNDTKWVSTVFLGLDHNMWWGGPPMVFESMAFQDEGRTIEVWGGGGRMHVPETLDCVRYSSWEDAEIGHQALVRKWLINAKTRVGVSEE